jgi:hypothetical protein
MDEKTRKVIQKCQKLLALASSDNEHEASLAMKRLGEIMARHEIDMAQVRMSQSEAERDGVEEKSRDGLGMRLRTWEGILCSGIAKAFDCQYFYSKGSKYSGRPWQGHYIGFKQDIQMALYFSDYLVRTVGRSVYDTEFTGKKEKNTFCMGMAARIVTRMREMYERKQEIIRTDPNCRALVISKGNEVARYMNQNHKLGKSRPVNITGSRHAYMAGQAAGDKVPLNRALNGGAGQKSIA